VADKINCNAGRRLAAEKSLQAAGDEQLHDLVGAGIDAHHPRIAIKPRDRVLVHVAVAAKQLQAAIDDLAHQVRVPVLGPDASGAKACANDDIVPMNFTQSLLCRIPEPSARLLMVITVFAAVAAMSFAILAVRCLTQVNETFENFRIMAKFRMCL
jgi:hypothetical protein